MIFNEKVQDLLSLLEMMHAEISKQGVHEAAHNH
jgi:hypothetical protein